MYQCANACQAVDSCGQIETSGESNMGYIEEVHFTKAAIREAFSGMPCSLRMALPYVIVREGAADGSLQGV